MFKSAKYNQHFTASLLLANKANVDATDLNGETPLHIAAGNGVCVCVCECMSLCLSVSVCLCLCMTGCNRV